MENEYIDTIFEENLVDDTSKQNFPELKNLFKEMQEALNGINELDIKKRHDKIGASTVLTQIKKHSGEYLPDSVVNSIRENYLGNTFVVDADLKTCKVVIKFYIMNNNPVTQTVLDIYTNVMLSWLIVAKKYETDGCLDNLKIDIYLTQEKKMLGKGNMYDANDSSKALGSDNVNTALTYRCVDGESIIILYRSEDMIKTFFHETFHTLNFDFTNAAKSEAKPHFNVNSPLRLYESYCETWGRTINAIYYVLLLNPRMTYSKFITYFRIVIAIEAAFSAIQCNKILNHMNLTWNDVLNNTVYDKFKEKSNVFSYYVITAILMANNSKFVTFCHKNGTNLLKFDESKLMPFIDFLGKAKHNVDMSGIEKAQFRDNSLRMAIFDIKN